MKITRQNYEIFAIDYLDNKLSTTDEMAFLAFLKENPDIAEELHSIRPAISPDKNDEISFDFSFLQKDYNSLSITNKNFDEMCIAYHEGDLDLKGKQKVLDFIGNDHQKLNTFKAYSQLRISPDNSVIFKNKSALKHKNTAAVPIRRIAIITSLAAAASLATVFMLRLNTPVNLQENQLASVKKSINNEIKVDIAGQKSDKTKPIEVKTWKKSKNTQSKNIDKSENIKIAVIDTASVDDSGSILISRIEAKSVRSEGLNFDLIKSQKSEIKKDVKQQPSGIEQIKEKGVSIYAKASRLTTNEIIQSGIKGINNLVETDLKYESQTDKDGRIVEYALSSDNFNFKRKVNTN